MSKILVTGGAGFIGSNLTEALLELGHEVKVLDNFATGKIENLLPLLEKYPEALTLQVGDIRNLDDCKKATEGIDYVFHEAALGSVPRSIKDPITSNDVNVTGFLNMLVASRDAAVITAGTHLAPSIRVAEAAKVIENSQRDINIAFVNELAKIFNRMNIDTQDVLEAAGTKWNFLPFKPGLVGGHCIGVDPYYLAQAAQRTGYNPEIILAGRRVNDGMGEYVADQVVKLMLRKGIQVLNSKVLILGFTFKENCPDVRNTKVIDIVHTLEEYNAEVTVHDPWADPAIAKHEYGIELHNGLPEGKFDAIILAVAHDKFIDLDITKITNGNRVVYDVKGVLSEGVIDGKL